MKSWQVAGIVALGSLGLYTLTSSHTVILDHDDAAEFQTIGAIGGIPHRPYPLWSIVARLFSFVPTGEPAFRITLLSITAAALALALFFVLVARIAGRGASLVATGALGLSMTFWQNATVAEVYSLNVLLLLALCALVVRWWRSRRPRDYLLACLALGFLLSYHQINLAIVPTLALLMWWHRGALGDRVDRRHRFIGIPLVALPFTLYLYTYFVDRQHSPINWHDNLGRYYFEALGNDTAHYQTFADRLRFQMSIGRVGPLLPKLGGFAASLSQWFRNLVSFEFPVVGTGLALAGLVSLARRPRLFILALVFIVPHVILAVAVAGGVSMAAFSLGALGAMAVLVGVGASRVLTHVRGPAARRATMVALFSVMAATSLLQLARSPASLARGAGCAFRCVPVSDVFWHLPASNDHGREYGEWFAKHMEPNSLVLAKWSEANVLLHYKHVLKRLDGVRVCYLLPDGAMMRSRIEEMRPDAVFFTFDPASRGFDTMIELDLPTGRMLYRVAPAGIAGPGSTR
ncbi:MAG TPA: DUF2723 domain-containing protein [Candidatus Krumholzibacteria bacterium]|nr:DUF2723 domain-containing protein [Candidatus Krumholzibacteria bacterium]